MISPISKKLFIFTAFLAVFFSVALIFSLTGKSAGKELTVVRYTNIIFKNTSVSAEVADTEDLRIRGLSEHSPLAKGEGMWFVFESDGLPGIWMKDMNFPIDILWFDKYLKITHIKENATPASYPEAFAPKITSRYVLEVPNGFVKKNSISLGDKVSL